MSKIQRSGWGRNLFVNVRYKSLENFSPLDTRSGAQGLAVGLGRSYGDSSLNSQGTSWQSFGLKAMYFSDSFQEITCGAGVTIGELERFALQKGLFPPVVPGTEFVSIGGAIASDIHGKSHHSFGSFGNNVLEIQLQTASGEILSLKPDDATREYFWATVGGMGLTGAILSAKLKLIPVSSSSISVFEQRVSSISEMLETLKEFDSSYLYTVAWIDLSGRFEGRGVVSGGNHHVDESLKMNESMEHNKNQIVKPLPLPPIPPFNYLNRNSVRIFNEFWYRKPLKRELSNYRPFLHPLDKIADWNKLYGRNGFLQYQYVIPYGGEHFLKYTLEVLRRHNISSALAVLKQFGSTNSKYLSFQMPGWTLAVDMPMKVKGLQSILRHLDDELTKIGGRVYLSKDSRLAQEHFLKMYPEATNWKKIKNELDPENYWRSMQGLRLGLC